LSPEYVTNTTQRLLIPMNKEAAIANHTMTSRGLRDKDTSDEAAAPAGPASEIDSVPSPRRKANRRPFSSSDHHAGRKFLVGEKALIAVPEEVMVADPRQALTPSQMVDQKLQALLGICPGSLRTAYRQTAEQAKGNGVIRRGLRLFRGA
jgi:hypothetical protein